MRQGKQLRHPDRTPPPIRDKNIFYLLGVILPPKFNRPQKDYPAVTWLGFESFHAFNGLRENGTQSRRFGAGALLGVRTWGVLKGISNMRFGYRILDPATPPEVQTFEKCEKLYPLSEPQRRNFVLPADVVRQDRPIRIEKVFVNSLRKIHWVLDTITETHVWNSFEYP